MNGIIYKCVRVHLSSFRTIPSFLRRNCCPENSRKSGWRFSTTLMDLWIYWSRPRWSWWRWTEWLRAVKWITKDQDATVPHRTTKSLWPSSTVILKLQIVRKILKTTPFLQELNLWNNSTICFTSLYRRKSVKMITGNSWVLYSRGLILQARVNTRSCNSCEPTPASFWNQTLTASTVRMQIWLCWDWHCRLAMPA